MYRAEQIAEYMVIRASREGHPVSNLKLQKLLYFVQAQFLVSRGRPCFGEAIEAWDFGPVIPSVYFRYRGYGSATIPFFGCGQYREPDREDRELIDGVMDRCSRYSSAELTDMACRQEPWLRAHSPRRRCVISNRGLMEFFS